MIGIPTFSNTSYTKKSTHHHSHIMKETPPRRTLPVRKGTPKSYVRRTSTDSAVFLWSLEFQKDLSKPSSLSTLFTERRKRGHCTSNQPTHDKWCYPVSQANIPIDVEDNASGCFLTIDNSLARSYIHDSLHSNRGNTLETLHHL